MVVVFIATGVTTTNPAKNNAIATKQEVLLLYPGRGSFPA
jgi:hypothetical protein